MTRELRNPTDLLKIKIKVGLVLSILAPLLTLTTITIIVQFFPAVTNDFLFHIPVTFRLRYGSVVIASRSSFSPTVPVGDGSPPGATLRYACPSGDTERR